jgi:general secretion pathway protein G
MRLRAVERAGLATGRAGFTLMELLVVVAILLLLMGVATPMYLNYLEKSKKDTARVQAKSLAADLKSFALTHNGEYPPAGTWDLLPLPPEKNPPLDPWGQPYQWELREIPQLDSVIMDPVVWSGGPAGNLGPLDELSSIN